MLKKLILSTVLTFAAIPALADIGAIIARPRGANGSVQISSNGIFGADSDFNYSTSTSRLNVSSMSATWAQISTAAVNKIIWADGTTSTTSTSGGGSGTDATKLPLDGSANMTGQLTSTTGTFTGSYFSVGLSTFVVKEGKVGIGTTAPASALSVVGNVDVMSGNLGVGTTNPSYPLDFKTSSQNDIASFYSSAGASSLLLGSAAGPNVVSYKFQISGTDQASIAYTPLGATSNSGLKFLVQGAYEGMRLNNTGYLGIGTTAASYRLHVSSGAGTLGTIMAISTGTVDLFAVHGTSVSLEVPLVFPDGTVQVTAGGAGAGDIEGVTAGLGLDGGGTTGTVTLDVDPSTVSMLGPSIDLASGEAVGDLPATRISAGTLDTDVVASSGAASFFYSANIVRTNLGLAIGTNVQAWDTDLDDLADGSLTGSKVGDGVPAANIATGILPNDVQTTSAAVQSILATALVSTDSPADNEIPTYDAATKGITWEAASGSGDVVASDTSTISGMKTFSSTSGMLITGQLTVQSSATFAGPVGVTGSGAGSFEITTTTGSVGTTGNPQAFGILGASSVAFNNGQLILQSTAATFNVNVFSTGGVTGADITATRKLTLPQSDDPDTTASGQISKDTDGWLRVYDGSAQKAIPVIETFHLTVSTPNAMPDANRDAVYFFTNVSSMSFIVQGWSALSDTDDTDLAIEECDFDGGNSATIDAVSIATNGTGLFYATDTTITAATVEATHRMRLDFDDADFPGEVQITIWGYYDADVN